MEPFARSVKDINKLFDALRGECGLSEAEIFRRVYGKNDFTYRKLFEFTKDVATCPEEVLYYLYTSAYPTPDGVSGKAIALTNVRAILFSAFTVKCSMDIAQVAIGNVRIDLCRRDISMSQKCLHTTQVSTVF